MQRVRKWVNQSADAHEKRSWGVGLETVQNSTYGVTARFGTRNKPNRGRGDTYTIENHVHVNMNVIFYYYVILHGLACCVSRIWHHYGVVTRIAAINGSAARLRLSETLLPSGI
ncbi:hypothetical protein ACS0PU_012472 [Formica fusca]